MMKESEQRRRKDITRQGRCVIVALSGSGTGHIAFPEPQRLETCVGDLASTENTEALTDDIRFLGAVDSRFHL